jgi:VanZ family protein
MLSFIKKRLSAPYVPVIWTLLICIAMCMPGNYMPDEKGFALPNFDKLVHFGLFGGFAFLWSLYLARRPISTHRMLFGFFCFYLLANGLGIGSEYAQKYWIPGRDYDLGDIIADMFGAGLGYGCSNLLLLPPEKNGNG